MSSPSYAFPHRQNERSVVSDVKKKPQLFDGSGDLEEYLAQFEILAEINNWDCSRKALYLASSLSGNALSVLGELPPTERRNYSLLVEILRNRYGSENRAEVFRSQLQTRVKNKNETMTELAQSVRKLTRKAYPGAPQHDRHFSVRSFY